jgi:hypothetical protein
MGGGSSKPPVQEELADAGHQDFASPVPGTNNFENTDISAGSDFNARVITANVVDEHEPFHANDYETAETTHDTAAETTKWAFELIPWYDEQNRDAVETLQSVIAGIHIDTRDDFGNTLLMMAVHHDKTTLVRWAIGQGADVNAINFAGVCALHICCHESSVHHEMVETLLENKANTEIPDSNGCTILHYAASAGDAKLVTLLLRYGSKAGAADSQGFTAIEYAFESGDDRCTAMLMDAQERQREQDNRSNASASGGREVGVAADGDWEEYVDHMSGHAYYFNKKTKETSWERPYGYSMQIAGAEAELMTRQSSPDRNRKKEKKDKKKKKKKKRKKERREREKALEESQEGEEPTSAQASKASASDDGSSSDSGSEAERIQKKKAKKAKKKRRKERESKEADNDDDDEEEGSKVASAGKRSTLLDTWRRVAWREGIKRVAQRRRRKALQAAREHMRQQQIETMRQMEEEHKKRMEELTKKTLQETQIIKKEAEKHKMEAAHHRTEAEKHRDEKEKIRGEISASTNEEKRRLEELAAKHKAEAEEWKRNHAEEQKAREIEEHARKETEKAYRIANERAKKEYNEKMNILGNIRVFARIRPLIGIERDKGCERVLSSEKYDTYDSVTVNNQEKGRKKAFQFDRVYTDTATQAEVYAGAEPLLQSALDGHNVCIFAYGQTGSGKTFTMNGDRKNKESRGLMPRTFDLVFEKIEQEKLLEVEVRMFMLELYLDKLIDLFSDSSDGQKEKIIIRKNRFGTVMPTGVNVRVANEAADLYDYFDEGMVKRKVSSTKMNAESSRSHLIVSIILNLKDKRTNDVSEGKITLVDLAGCERVKKSGAEDQALKEAQSINQSLSALGNVVSAVLGGQKHIPYRSNVLTLLMSDTVGGNAKAQMFVNLSPADYNASESENSMVFAQRVKQIKNQSKSERDAEIVKIKLQKQVMELQRKLDAQQKV